MFKRVQTYPWLQKVSTRQPAITQSGRKAFVTSIYHLSDGCVGEQPRMISSTLPENTNPSLLLTVADLFGILWPKFVLFSRMKVCDST
ncbi:hypothetical protein FVEG_15800 [Fusarium verticillioides 7600]|uniref:Uncharacterized protein n=1 Tax=Gibberella moniliformis (strain M3125 / FGSC 7600) TaxID=334819 RepID=W7MKD2_GIBM7|nr:hypothetical protein FVEG_15800 [Fusarium verticillioides 7600]EWG45142.1 hypothetical protein FVEG_15800 [Fusarium verticillioides 7600]